MRPPHSRITDIRAAGAGSGAASPPSQSSPQVLDSTVQRRSSSDGGILVEESELGSVTAQQLFKMRCECGRSWFVLELPELIECPACRKMNLVSR